MRVGIDLVSVELVRETVAVHGERYLKRIYTAQELEDCSGDAGVDPERLGARFAAKEAALKALAPQDEGIEFSSIEVRRTPRGSVNLALSGKAAEAATAAGMTDFAVSLTHEAGFACAVVIAT